ncbi:MAG: hypothetical protein ACPGVB_00985 [Chitinophagales bacterium]
MLQRYFFITLITCLCLSACQNNKDGNSNTSDTHTEDTSSSITASTESANEKTSPKIKSLKEAAKDQQKKVRAKIKEAQKEQENNTVESKRDLKIDKQTKTNISKNNLSISKNESTKERLLRNLREGQRGGRNKGNPSPSRDFMQAARSLADIDLRIEKVGKKQIAGYEWYGKVIPIDDFYAFTSLDGVWGGPLSQKKGAETEELFLKDVNVFEAVFKSTKVVKGLKHDVKVTEIQFVDKAAAEAAIPKIKVISEAIAQNPKHLNEFWQDDNRFYIIETRSASFKPTLEIANKVLYFNVTSSK